MGLKDKDDEKTLKKLLDWLAAIGGVAAFLVGILTLFLDEDNAKKIAWGIAIVLAIASSVILFIQRQREKKLKIAELVEPISPTATLRGLLPFEVGDQLPGRGRDVQDLYTLITNSTFRFGVLWGESGCGKTSLLRAGLVSKLREGKFLPLYINKPTNNPVEAIRSALLKEVPDTEKNSKKSLNQLLKIVTPKDSKLIILFDQFEEFFLTNRTSKSRASFSKWLGDTVENESLSVSILIGIKANFFAQLQSFWPHIPEPTSIRTSYQLQNFDIEQAKQIFSAAAKADGIPFEPELIQAVISELETKKTVRPAELQVVGTRLKRKNITSLNKFEALGGARGILSSYINEEIKQSPNEQAAKLILRLMCAETVETKSPTDLSFEDILNGVRRAPVADTARDTIRQEEIQKILTQFITARVLIRTDENKYNLAHDYLTPYVNTATEGAETNVERANKLLKRYVAEYREDAKTRIPFRHLRAINKYATQEVKSKRKAQEILKKSIRVPLAMMATPVLLVGALYLFLASSYYFSLDASSFVVIKSGHPQLKFIPGFDKTLIQTDFTEDDMAVDGFHSTQLTTLTKLEEISGFRFDNGYSYWEGSIFRYLDTYPAMQVLRLRYYQTLIENPGFWNLSSKSPSAPTSAYIDHMWLYPESVTPEVAQLFINHVKIDNWAVRERVSDVFSVIAQINPEYITPEIVQMLVGLLEDDSRSVRKSAADTLSVIAQVNPEYITPEIVQILVALLENDRSVRDSAANTLSTIVQARPELITSEIVQILIDHCFENRNDDIRADAANALSAIVQANPEYITPEFFEKLIYYAGNNNKNIRNSAFIVLNAVTKAQPESITSETIQKLFDIYFKETDENVKESVLDLFSTITQENPGNITHEMVQLLLNNLQDDDDYVRSRAIEALGTIAVSNPDGFTPKNILFLAKLLEKEDDPNELGSIVIILGNIAKVKPELFTPEIVQATIYTTEKLDDNISVLNALGIIAQTNPESFTPEIAQILIDFNRDSNRFYGSENAASALFAIFQSRPEGPGPQLNQMLLDNPYHAIIIIKTMAQSNPKNIPPETIQILEGMFEDENTNTKWLPDIFLIILQFKPEQITPEMVWKLIKLISSVTEESDYRYYSERVLNVLGITAKVKPESFSTEIIQNLIEMLEEDEGGYSHRIAYDVLRTIAPIIPDNIAPNVVNVLFTQLKDDLSSSDREQASRTLANIALKNPSQEIPIREELDVLLTGSQPTHWQMATAKCLDMIAIGKLVEEAKSNPVKIEQIRSRLDVLSKSKESHLDYAADLALIEIEKLELEIEQ